MHTRGANHHADAFMDGYEMVQFQAPLERLRFGVGVHQCIIAFARRWMNRKNAQVMIRFAIQKYKKHAARTWNHELTSINQDIAAGKSMKIP